MDKFSPAVSMKQYHAAAKVLGVPLLDLFTDARTEMEMRLVEEFRSLPESAKAHWFGLIQIAKAGPASPGSDEADRP